jgi:flagellar motor protein MotB
VAVEHLVVDEFHRPDLIGCGGRRSVHRPAWPRRVSIGLRGEQGRLEGVRRDLLFTLQSNLDKRGVKVEVDAGRGILRLSREGLFELNEDRFTPKGEENARALLEEMARLLPCHSSASSASLECAVRQPIFEIVLIEGHTDTRPTDRRGGNWTLSPTARARSWS